MKHQEAIELKDDYVANARALGGRRIRLGNLTRKLESVRKRKDIPYQNLHEAESAICEDEIAKITRAMDEMKAKVVGAWN